MKSWKTAAFGSSMILAMMLAILPAVILDAVHSALRAEAAPPPAPRPAEPAAVQATPAQDDPEAPLALARRGVERGFLELSLNPQTWNRVQTGNAPAGFRLDSVYNDPERRGDYSVGLSSGPLFGQVTITAVARASKQVRAVSAVYDYVPSAPLREVYCRWDDGSPRCP